MAGSNLTAQNPSAIKSSVMLWTLKGTFEQKLEIAARAGLDSVELVDEHIGWTEAQFASTKKLARSFNLGMDTIIATPDWKRRPVSMVRPDQRSAFLADVKQSIEFARRLEIPQIILISGDEVPGIPHEAQAECLVEGMKRAGELASAANLTLIIEPLNSKVDHKGVFLTNCVEGLKMIRQVDNPHVKLLFDIYHEQVQLGDVIRTIRDAASHTAVFHIADNPGRNDPGTGEIHYDNVYKAIRKTGYGGYITMEYLPIGDPVTSLSTALKQMRAAIG